MQKVVRKEGGLAELAARRIPKGNRDRRVIVQEWSNSGSAERPTLMRRERRAPTAG